MIHSLMPRYLIALVVTVCAYFTYATFVAPHLVGNTEITKVPGPVPSPESDSELLNKIIENFREGDWERMPCKIVETRQGLIFFQDYQPGDDGKLELRPLTMVLYPSKESGSNVDRKPIVIRAPEGAQLKFERSLSLFSGNVGQLEEGQLEGEVQIYRLPSDPSKDDGIEVITQNVQLSPEQIRTLYPVRFRFGKSNGRGKTLTVDLTSGRADENQGNFSGIERIQLAELHELYLHQEKKAQSVTSINGSERGEMLGDSSRPIHITSAGPFVFDFRSKLATFHGQVHVKFVDESADNMICDQLSIWFQNDAQNDPTIKPHEGGFDVQRLAATGKPVEIHATSKNTYVRAELVDYDMVANKIIVRDPSGGVLRREDQRITSPDIVYHVLDDGRLGNGVILGPGELFQAATDEREAFVCQWKRRLTMQADDQRKVLTFDGANISLGDKTTLAADQLHFWIWEVPQIRDANGKQRWKFVPSKMFADGNVTVESPDLIAECDEAAAFWPRPIFDQALFDPSVHPKAMNVQIAQSNQRTTHYRGLRQQESHHAKSPSPNAAWHTATVRPHMRTSLASGPQETGVPAEQDTATSLTRIRGRQVQMQMRDANDPGEINEVTVDENVHVVRQTTEPNQDSKIDLEIHGHKLRVLRVTEDLNRIFVSGNAQSPALISTQGMDLYGPVINLDQAVNRLWIDGSGKMQMSETADLADSTPLTPGGTTEVTWSGGMIFDGQQIYFENAVQSDSTQFDEKEDSRTTTYTHSAALSLMLNQRVDFANSSTDVKQSNFQIERMVLLGQLDDGSVAFPNVAADPNQKLLSIVSQKFSADGKQLSYQQIDAVRANFAAQSGAANCVGPGSLTIRQSKNASEGGMRQALPVGHQRTSSKPIEYVKVDFEDSLVGNLESKEMKFDGNVHCFYDGVTHWTEVPDEQDIFRANATGMILDCNQLDLAQWQPRDAAEPIVEMIASGDARLKSGELDARADTITYFEATGRIKIDGGSRSPAELRLIKGGSRTDGTLIARTIVYNLVDGTYEVQGNKGLSIDIDRNDRNN